MSMSGFAASSHDDENFHHHMISISPAASQYFVVNLVKIVNRDDPAEPQVL